MVELDLKRSLAYCSTLGYLAVVLFVFPPTHPAVVGFELLAAGELPFVLLLMTLSVVPFGPLAFDAVIVPPIHPGPPPAAAHTHRL